MRRILLVNASAPSRNLGLEKAAAWWRSQGAAVREARPPLTMLDWMDGVDEAWISAVFSWHVPGLIHAAQTLAAFGCRVEVGGPGCFGVQEAIEAATGLKPQATPDARLEGQRGDFSMVFWSRGCPAKNCSLGYPRNGAAPICSVPAMEGWKFTLYPDAQPVRVIADNNVSALPKAHQEHMIERTLAAGFESVDCNSGFEPKSLRPETIERWRRVPLVAWRFAYDEIAERAAVEKAIRMFDDAGISRRALRIYCIAGNEPIEACEQRVMDIVKWKAYAIVQRRRPLDWTGGPLPTLHDWTEQRLIDFQRWGTRLAKGKAWKDYRRGFKTAKADR